MVSMRTNMYAFSSFHIKHCSCSESSDLRVISREINCDKIYEIGEYFRIIYIYYPFLCMLCAWMSLLKFGQIACQGTYVCPRGHLTSINKYKCHYVQKMRVQWWKTFFPYKKVQNEGKYVKLESKSGM